MLLQMNLTRLFLFTIDWLIDLFIYGLGSPFCLQSPQSAFESWQYANVEYDKHSNDHGSDKISTHPSEELSSPYLSLITI